MEEILKDFLVEAGENLDRLDQDLVRLEQSPGDQKIIGNVFRALHTIKGSSGFFAFKRLEKVAHAGESLLGKIRDGRLTLNADMVTTLLAALDRLREIVRGVEDTKAEPGGDDAELIAVLHALGEGKVASVARRGAPAPASAPPVPAAPRAAAPTPPAPPARATTPAPASANIDSFLRDFLAESHENLDALDRAFVALEQAPHDRALLSNVFRTLHTLKGSSGFFGFWRLEKVAHAAESLLGKLRSGELLLNEAMTATLLGTVDGVRESLKHIEQTGQESGKDFSAPIEILKQLAEGKAVAAPAAEKRVAPVSAPASPLSPALSPGGGEGEKSAGAAPAAPSAADSTVRVDVGLLDKLMNLVGELVLARNRLLPFAVNHADAAFTSATQRLDGITTELQERVMKTRMQPINHVWSKFPRLVRDLSAQCGKQVNLVMEGTETELDRTLLDAIKDPLTHMVRNCVDHGIEPPDTRVAAGKPAAGRLLLRAYHESGLVVIEISDDGAGINLARVRQKAVEKGFLKSEQAARLTDRQATDLIFLPGFSTAETTTSVSGRGVGMDVVKTNIENSGGSIELSTVAGQGTTLRLKIPLTLAIVPALFVGCAGGRFAIAQTSLLELVRLDPAQDGSSIEDVYGAPVCRLRGKLLPLVFLKRELQLDRAGDLQSPPHDATEAKVGDCESPAPAEPVTIVVLQSESHRFGLVVDEVHDTEEIVVKPVGALLKGIPAFAGATILGDGSVALILDVAGLAEMSGVATKLRERPPVEDAPALRVAHPDEKSLLLFHMGGAEHMAIPLDLVTRLEKFPRTSIERSGGREVVQYDGGVMPLVRVADFVEGCPATVDSADTLDVVVHHAKQQPVGFVVGQIRDIVTAPLRVADVTRQRGLLGSAVVNNQITGVLDVPAILKAARPEDTPKLMPITPIKN
ncbi:MAG: two-component system chemotaxis family sensor kinase CheA [Limisphaerales bacterium]|nr:MAG: two-component system chemotaxis family sensor kinase CheA [Limisphaerales bacterium]KAG0509235.1 MAG: two-component system chemotaxis family sensor kinase CheA [Limisphaerales bacterium]TXT52226.1 MAG: two-component system chemotaxis family sensor kinase CheA [Limisphaerales bacterium]